MAGSFVLNTGASIPSVGLGTWRIQPEVLGDTIYAAVKAGYRHIDCAPAYSNEKEVECHLIWQQDKLRELCQLRGVHLSAHSPLGEASILGNHIVVSVAERVRKTPA